MDLFTGPIFCEILHEILSSDVEYLRDLKCVGACAVKEFRNHSKFCHSFWTAASDEKVSSSSLRIVWKFRKNMFIKESNFGGWVAGIVKTVGHAAPAAGRGVPRAEPSPDKLPHGAAPQNENEGSEC